MHSLRLNCCWVILLEFIAIETLQQATWSRSTITINYVIQSDFWLCVSSNNDKTSRGIFETYTKTHNLFETIEELQRRRRPTKIPFILHFIVHVCVFLGIFESFVTLSIQIGRYVMLSIFGATFITVVQQSWSEANIMSKHKDRLTNKTKSNVLLLTDSSTSNWTDDDREWTRQQEREKKMSLVSKVSVVLLKFLDYVLC